MDVPTRGPYPLPPRQPTTHGPRPPSVWSGPGHWKPLNDPALGFMNAFSENIKGAEARYSGLLPDLRRGWTILVGSDYSGHGGPAYYEALSFVFVCLEECGVWERLRTELRRRLLPDGRRMSYKQLRDRKRRRALVPFLQAANTLPGMLATVLIDKRIKSIFRDRGRILPARVGLTDCSRWDTRVLERVLRTVHLISFFIAGLSAPGQDLLWVTDQDEIAPNEPRMRELLDIFVNIGSHYLKHDLRCLRIGTTASDTGKRDVEDLVSVADLAAGAVSRVMTEYRRHGGVPTGDLLVPLPKSVPLKARNIMDWFSDDCQPLRRLVYAIEPTDGSPKLVLKRLRSHGTGGTGC